MSIHTCLAQTPFQGGCGEAIRVAERFKADQFVLGNAIDKCHDAWKHANMQFVHEKGRVLHVDFHKEGIRMLSREMLCVSRKRRTSR